MRCSRCGKVVLNNTLFCQFCGQELGHHDPTAVKNGGYDDPTMNTIYVNRLPAPKKANTSTILLISIILTCVIAIALGAGIAVYANGPERRLEKQLSLGDRYLSDLNYEEAVAAYQAAIEIDPMNVKGYEGLAEAYVGLEDYDKAMDALHEGYETTSKRILLTKEADVCLDYIAILDENGDVDRILAILDERSALLNDDRIQQALEEYQEQQRAAAYDIKAAPAAVEEAAPAPVEEAESSVVDDTSWEACINKREELVGQLGQGFIDGTVIEDFAFYDEYGNIYHISDFAGKMVYINFFTTWCPYCYYEIPDMQRVHDEYRDEDGMVIMIDLQETVEEAQAYATEYGITMPIYYLDDWQAGSLSIEGVPLSIVIDRYGVIHDVHEGMSDYAWMSTAMNKAYNTAY